VSKIVQIWGDQNVDLTRKYQLARHRLKDEGSVGSTPAGYPIVKGSRKPWWKSSRRSLELTQYHIPHHFLGDDPFVKGLS
jgi:hypothetical protein